MTSENDRLIDEVLVDVIKQYEAGKQVDLDQVARAHSELGEELDERLRELPTIWDTYRNIGKQDSADSWIIEDLNILRTALPRYNLHCEIHRGGQAVVYAATQAKTGRPVAVKFLTETGPHTARQRERFSREIEISERLQHQNIIRLFGAGAVRGRPYYVMEYVDGRSIDSHVIFEDLTPREIVQLFVKVCRAVAYAHQNGVIHRDLSSANVLVDGAGEPRISDFGLAKDITMTQQSLTGQGILGTLPYLSPEQLGEGDCVADVRSDVYALGVLLYHLLTRDFPFRLTEDNPQNYDQIRHATPESLRKALQGSDGLVLREQNQINRDLETIIGKALLKEKDRRYQTAGEFADDLERWLTGAAITARSEHAFYVFRKTLRKHLAVTCVASVSLVALLLMGYQVLEQRGNARAATIHTFDMFEQACLLEEAVESLPGGMALRDQFVDTLADRVPQLQKLLAEDESFSQIQIRLYEKQGDLALQQGQREEAAEFYQQLLEGSQLAVEDSPDSIQYANALTRAYRKCAEASEQPTPYFEAGISWGEQVLAKEPEQDDARYELCQIHLSFGEHFELRKEFARTLEQLDAAAELYEGVVLPDTRQWQALLAQILEHRGRSLISLGSGEEGISELYDSLEIRERNAEDYPVDVRVRYELMLAYSRIATVEKDSGNLDNAIGYCHQAIQLGERLRELDPQSAEFGFSLYSAYDKITRLFLPPGDVENVGFETKDLETASVYCKLAVALAEELADLHTAVTNGTTTLGYAHLLQGRVQLKLGEYEPALTSFQRSLALRESQLAGDPNNTILQVRIAVIHGWLAQNYRKLREYETAETHYRRTKEIYSSLYKSHPESVVHALNAIQAMSNLSVSYIDAKTTTDDLSAKAVLEEAQQRLENLDAAGHLVGHERRKQEIENAIQSNLNIVLEREAIRSEP